MRVNARVHVILQIALPYHCIAADRIKNHRLWRECASTGDKEEVEKRARREKKKEKISVIDHYSLHPSTSFFARNFFSNSYICVCVRASANAVHQERCHPWVKCTRTKLALQRCWEIEWFAISYDRSQFDITYTFHSENIQISCAMNWCERQFGTSIWIADTIWQIYRQIRCRVCNAVCD